MVDVARGTVHSRTYKPLNNDQGKNADKPYVGIRSSGRKKLQKARENEDKYQEWWSGPTTRACSINRTS